jgi:hypothetical protein
MKIFSTQLMKSVYVVPVVLMLVINLFLPQLTFAAMTKVVADNAAVAVGDTAIVSVKLDTQGRKPNTVEGDITITSGAKNITISEFTLAGSVLSFWPKTPSLDSSSKISFIGGVPGGFKGGDGLLFKIVFTADSEGEVVFTPADIKVYDNDGKATVLESSVAPLTITIGPKGTKSSNHWLDIIATDTKAPHDIKVTFGQDPTVFDGKKFMTISALDDESGIDYYEVSEGDRPAVRSGNTYVLMDQREKSVMTVIAYDKAGNNSKILLTPAARQTSSSWPTIIAVIVGLLLLLAILKVILVMKKRRKHLTRY